jgi:CubicO group peptidase (beta-lactamase class C family)
VRLVKFFIASVLLLVIIPFAQPQVPAPEYWPTEGWRESTPERQGIDSAALLNMFDYVRKHGTRVHSVLIIRNGYVVVDASFFPYDSDSVHDLASVTKSVTSTMIGIAIQQGKISDVHANLSSFFRRQQKQDTDPRKARITLADLLSMRSGLQCPSNQSEQLLRQMMHTSDWVDFALKLPMAEAPGKHFEYCSGDYHLLSAVLSKAASMNAAEYARTGLFEPLGIRDIVWPPDPQGVTRGWGDLHLRPRDAAKLGFLWLHGGMWKGKQLVPASWFHEATTALTSTMSRDAGYGYGFWVFVGRRAGEYEALGRGGQRITIVPKLNALVVLTGGGFEPGEIGGFIAAAVKSDKPLPENPAAAEQLHRAMAAAAAGPSPGQTSALSPTAKAISGKKYALETNPLDLADLTLSFAGSDAATFEMNVVNGRSETHPVSLNGRPALSPGQFGLPVALNGRWQGDTFVLYYDEIANNHAYELQMTFQGSDVHIEVREPMRRTPLIIRGSTK